MPYYPAGTHLNKEEHERVKRCLPLAGCNSLYGFVKLALMEKVESLEEAEKHERQTTPREKSIGKDSGKDRRNIEDIDEADPGTQQET